MSYIDVLKVHDTIHVVERRNGKRIFQKMPAKYVFYAKNAKGTFTSIYGDPLVKFETSSYKHFQKEVRSVKQGNLFEHDINPVIRFLENNYSGAEAPELHVAFFDIEVDFDPEIGFSNPSDPYCAVNAISVYQSWTKTNKTLVLKPDTITWDQAADICDTFEDTVLCHNEEELFDKFFELIDDADVMSGWNCIDKNEPIYLENKIICLKDAKKGQITSNGSEILDYHDSGMKKNNVLKTVYGFELNVSDEHKIPIYSKKHEEYKYPSTLLKNKEVLTVKQIKEKIQNGFDVYIEHKKHENTNPDYTIREYIIEYFDRLMKYDCFDIIIKDENIKDSVLKQLREKNEIEKWFKHKEYYHGKNFFKKGNQWSYKRLKDFVNKDDIINQIKNIDEQIFKFSHTNKAHINISESFSFDILQLLGLIFTDGFYSTYDNDYRICNKNKGIIDEYESLIIKNNLKNSSRLKRIWKFKEIDKCYYVNLPKNNNILGLCYPLMYDTNGKKNINLEMWSRFSTEQFAAFFSGAVDGDGWITEKSIYLCNFQDQITKFHQLLLWNNTISAKYKNEVKLMATENNIEFISRLNLHHNEKKEKIKNLKIRIRKNSPSKRLYSFEYDDKILLKIKSITETDKKIEMSDIMTSDEYFVCNGIKVHNSTTFDIPYLVKRLEKIKNRDSTKRFCLWKQFPRKRTFEKFGKEQLTYDIYGRVHLDYLELYQKHTYHEMHSYSLDFVGQHETGDRKTPYEGSLDKLYKYDFRKFIEYNRQDVMLLVKIDNKNRFIDLSNQLAHENNVLLQNTLGSVALIDQAIINEIHNQNLIAPSKKKFVEGITSVAGAYVANPKKGMHKWIGSVDINSLYPSVIRALNMSPETIMGQFRLDRTMEVVNKRMKESNMAGEAWADFFGVTEYQLIQDENFDEITLDLEDGDSVTNSAKVWYDTIYTEKSGICLSANGTLFRTDTKGIIPHLLERWYNERVETRKEADDLFKEVEVLREKRLTLAATGHKDMLEAVNMEIVELREGIAFRDKRQLIKKILLNSLYGALLNPHCRFFDQRMGQSVTLTGRCITKHMIAKMNELFTGDYNHEGETIIYGDTDSAYVSAVPAFKETDFEWNKENVMELYDIAADQMNETFPSFMLKAFNVSHERGSIIQAGREVCASSGIFIKKKRYALLCYDIEGRRFDVDNSPGKVKAMGVDMKRSDTPKVIQNFLSDVLMLTLQGDGEQVVMEHVRRFRKEFRKWPGWQKGTPKRVNALTKQVEMERTLGRVNMAGHQRAAMNWNNLKQMHGDNYSMEIQDGFKVIVCKLLPNPLKLVSVAYPIDQEHLPEWFKELPFDHASMEDKLIDSKLKNLVGVLKWTLKRPEDDTTFDSLFT